jgi:hypothetical protein
LGDVVAVAAGQDHCQGMPAASVITWCLLASRPGDTERRGGQVVPAMPVRTTKLIGPNLRAHSRQSRRVAKAYTHRVHSF